MELNKNLEAALEKIEASEKDKELLRTILYKEHLNRGRNWDNTAPKEIKEIMHESVATIEEDKNNDIN